MTPFGEELKGLEKYCREQGRRYPILAAHVLARTLLDSKKGDRKLDDGLSSDEVLRTLSFATVYPSSFLLISPLLSSFLSSFLFIL